MNFLPEDDFGAGDSGFLLPKCSGCGEPLSFGRDAHGRRAVSWHRRYEQGVLVEALSFCAECDGFMREAAKLLREMRSR